MLFRKPAFGLDISDYSIEVLQLNRRKKAVAFNRMLLEVGVVKDGIILDKEKLTEKIKETVFLARTKSSQVILSLPESKIFTHILQLPKDIGAKELTSAIISEAAKTVPLEIEKVYWDYQRIPAGSNDEYQYIFYVGTLKEIIDDYIEVLDGAGLEPIIFEIESLALNRAIFIKRKLKSSVALADIGARTTNISIFDKNGILRLSAVVPLAGYHLTKAISESLKISLKEAEKRKRKHGLSAQEKEISLALESELQIIVNEIKKNIQYYSQPPATEGPKELIIVGGSALLPKIIDYFSKCFKIKVSIGLSEVAKQLKGKPILYNTVIGLALRGIKKHTGRTAVNLLPLSARPKPSFVDKRIRENKLFKYLGFLFGLVAIIILGWVVYTYLLKDISQPSSFEVIPEEALVEEELETTEPEETPEETMEEEETEEAEESEEPVEEIGEPIGTVTIKETETGWLNVRQGPGIDYEVMNKINPGESYPLLEESGKWYKIELDDSKVGFIFAKYASQEEAIEE